MSTWQLYEIDERIRNLIDAGIDEETGEVSVELEKALDLLELERDAAAESVALMIRELQAEAEAVKAEGERLMKRAKRLQESAGDLKDKLAPFLGHGNKLKTARVSVWWSASTSIQIENESALPFWALKSKVYPDKAELKRAMKSGTEEERAELEGNVHEVKRPYLVIR